MRAPDARITIPQALAGLRSTGFARSGRSATMKSSSPVLGLFRGTLAAATPRAVLIGALLACGVGGCAGQPAPTQMDLAWAANQARDAQELKRFDVAAAQTADGSRAYEYIWDSGWGPDLVGHKIILLVQPDGEAVLLGAANSPVTLTAGEIRPFEDAVAAAGFPHLPSGRADQPCSDGSPIPTIFVASIGGRMATSRGGHCGEVAIPLDRAVGALRALVDANGGPEPKRPRIDQVPTAVKAFSAMRQGDGG